MQCDFLLESSGPHVRAGEKRLHFGRSWAEPLAPEMSSPVAATR